MQVAKYYGINYVDPLIRAAPYLLGMILGWAIDETKKTNYKLSKVITIKSP